MMTNLFSMFDPSTFYMSSGWLILIIVLLMSNTPNENLYSNKMKKTFTLLKTLSKKEFKTIMSSKTKKNSILMMNNLFISCFLLNFLSMFMHNFTITAHISFSFPLAMTLWMSTMLFGWSKSFSKMMSHMTPVGTPPQLMNFMVLIETVSNIIRPITLSVRLSANMIAGHLLMELISNFSNTSMKHTILSTLPTTLLISLEMMVCVIQSFVLTTLIILYHNESL